MIKYRLLTATLVLCGFQFACGAITVPVRSVPPTSDIPLVIAHVPEILQKGETDSFVAKTNPLNMCEGVIGYRDSANKWITVDLPKIEADSAGECRWEWTVPEDSSAGIAEFRVAARQHSDRRMLIPQTFCIEACPP
jgi:hypothetical protein